MKISLFNGGLNTRKDPTLIASNEAVECENVDTSTGLLKSAKDVTATATEITNVPYYWEKESEWQNRAGSLEYMEYQDDLYWTTSGRAQKYNGTTVRNLGITAPTVAPVISGDTTSYVTALAEAKSFGLLFVVTQTVGYALITKKTYTVVLTLNSVVIYKQTKYSATSPADLTVELDDEDITAVVYTPADYTATTNNLSGVTMVVGTPPALGANLVANMDLAPTPIDKIITSVDIEAPNKLIFAVGYRSNSSSIISRPVECNVRKYNQTYIKLTGSTNVFGPVSYPYYMVFYIKLNNHYYVINEQAIPSTSFTAVTLSYNYLVNINVASATKWVDTNLLGTYQYVYTYYNNTDGTESAPSPLSSEIDVYGQSISLASLVASTDSQVTHKRIYRVGGTTSNFMLVAEITNATTTYIDSIKDSSLTGAIFDAILNTPPVNGLRYITEIFGTFFGFKGPLLYFTRDIGNPNYWPSTYYIDFYSNGTGVGLTATTALAFTKYKTYAILGSSANTYSKHIISNDQGCINHATIVGHKGQLLFASTDGICSTSGNSVEVLSKFNLGKQSLNTVNACIHDETYYLQLIDNSILAFDFRYEPNIKTFDFGTNYVLTALDTLYGRRDSDDKMCTLLTGAAVEFTYKTGRLTEGAVSVLKSYNKVYVKAEATTQSFTIKIWIDGTLRLTQVLTGELLYEVTPPQDYQQGYDIQFEIVGTGTIQELEYSPVGRQNGR